MKIRSALFDFSHADGHWTSDSFVTICCRRVCTNSGRQVAIMPEMNMVVPRVFFSLYTTTRFVQDNGKIIYFSLSLFPLIPFLYPFHIFICFPPLSLIDFPSYRHSFPSSVPFLLHAKLFLSFPFLYPFRTLFPFHFLLFIHFIVILLTS